MKKIIFLLAILFLASFSFLNAQNFVQESQDATLQETKPSSGYIASKADYILRYINGNATAALGNDLNGTRYISGCIDFTAAQMSNYIGGTLHQVNVSFPAATSMVGLNDIKIWIKGALDGAILYEQNLPISSLIYNGWNNVTLTTPYTLPAGSLVIGYTVTLTSATTVNMRPLHCSNVPADTYKPGGFNYIITTIPTAHTAGATWAQFTTAGNLGIEGLVTGVPELPVNDLACGGISSMPLKWPGNPVPFNINVYNAGTAPQNNYTVQLLDAANNVLATQAVTTPIASGAFADITVYYTPTVAGTISVKGKVVLVGDQNPNNDISPTLTQKVYDTQPMAYCGYAAEGNIGSGSGNTFSAAIGYPAADMVLFQGQQLHTFEVLLGDLTSQLSNATIWIRNSLTGANLYQQSFTPVAGWNTITLSTPYTMPMSGDIFLGYTVTTTGGYPLGTTANIPQNGANGGHLRIGTGAWQSLASNSLPGNNGIIGVMTPSTTATIVANASPAIGGTVTGGGTYNKGQTVTLTATPSQNFMFEQWMDGVTNPVRTFTALGNATYTANFAFAGFGDCIQGESIHGTATTGTYDIPINTYYNYSYSQQIFTAEELGLNCGDIVHEVAFQYIFATPQGPNGKINQTFYLGATNKNVFTGTTDWVPVAQLQQVFTGTVIYNNSEPWSTIVFDVPFIYTGGNLVLAVLNGHGGYNTGSSNTFRMSPSGGNRTLHFRQDGSPINPASPPTATGMITNRSNTKFSICKYEYEVDMAAISITGPSAPKATEPSNYDVLVRNFGTLPADNYTVSIVTEGGVVLAAETFTTPLAPNALTTHTITVIFPQALAGPLNVKGVVTIDGDLRSCNNATPLLPLNVKPHPGYVLDCSNSNDIQAGTGTTSIRNAPMDPYFNYSYAQQIYDAAEIGLPAGAIGAISFRYTFATPLTFPFFDVYLKNTTQATFATTTNWIPVDGTDKVYSGALSVANGWVTIVFDDPFEYEGNNILVAVNGGIGAYYGSSTATYWQVTNMGTNNNKTMYLARDASAYTPESGSPGTGTRNVNRPNAIFAFCDKAYTLNPSNIYGHGAVVTMVPNPVPHGQNAMVYFNMNDDCYYIGDVIIDGVSMGPIASYPFNNVIKNLPIIEVITYAYEYEIVATPGPNGTIDPIGTVPVDCGGTMTFDFIPDPGYSADEVLFNGELFQLPAGAGVKQWTTPSVTNLSNTLYVTFKEHINIFASAGPNGTIAPSGNVAVPYRTDKRFNLIPSTGHVIHKVFVDQVEVDYTPIAGTDNGYFDFIEVTEPHTIYVTFTKKGLCIDAAVMTESFGKGTITPEGPCVPVLYNDIKIFTFTPEFGYKVSAVEVDDVPFTPAIETGEYTFWYITKNHKIRVGFELKTYPITAMVNGNGTITPLGTTYVNHTHNPEALSIEYTITVNTGYEIANLFVDGIDVKHTDNLEQDALIPNKYYYKFYGVTEPHTISVITALKTLTINASAGEGGYISPSGNINVNYGQNRMFNFIPATGYEIDMVLVDGAPNGEAVLNGSYAFINVTTDHTIHVSFKKMTFKMQAKAYDKGSIAPAGITEVTYGEDIVYTITPDEGYKISSVLVNGKNVGAVSTYAFNEVEADGIIEAFFTVLGTNEHAIEGISIYSQNNTVHIVNTNLLPIRDVSIIDMYGRVIWQGKVYNERNEITLDVATGIYNVRVITDERFTTTKVSIQR